MGRRAALLRALHFMSAIRYQVCIHFAEKVLSAPCTTVLGTDGAAGAAWQERTGDRTAQALAKRAGEPGGSGHVWPLDAFLAAWDAAAPAGMTPDVSMLQGEALIDGESSGPCLSHSPHQGIPFRVQERARMQRSSFSRSLGCPAILVTASACSSACAPGGRRTH